MAVPRMIGRAAAALLLAAAAAAAITACGGGTDDLPTATPPGTVESTARSTSTPVPAGRLALTGGGVKDGERVPVQYTCDGANKSPALEWTGTPPGTRAFALLMVDPDAPRKGGFVHWVVFNLPASATSLAESASPGGTLPEGTLEGNNSAGRAVYTGPCPPAGQEHRYVFRLFALDAPLALKEGAAGDELLRALETVRVLDESTLTAIYGRR